MDSDEYKSTPHMPFFILGNGHRYDLIRLLLQHDNLKPTQMAEKLDIPLQNFSRDLSTLYKQWDWLTRDKDDNYHLKPWVKTMCKVLFSTSSFITKNIEYWEDHDFGDIRDSLLQQIGVFDNTHCIRGKTKITEKWKKIYKNADVYIYNTFYEAEYSKEIMDIVYEKLKNGIHTKTIFSDDSHTLFPDDHKEITKKFSKFKTKGQIEQRTKNKVSVSVVMTEKEAFVMFPRIKGQTDIEEAFYSDDKNFHMWCKEYFEHYWSNAEQLKTGGN
ncbi:MAG: hypothetical protein OEQ15_02525 [Nitrosopumilus sp.]|nr:hypothetical protein [Nitrosopumilus sp.]MDH3853005.1 hypothetical protein [Nitrosopumilus sp.]